MQSLHGTAQLRLWATYLSTFGGKLYIMPWPSAVFVLITRSWKQFNEFTSLRISLSIRCRGTWKPIMWKVKIGLKNKTCVHKDN